MMLLIREKRICPLSLQNPFPVSGKTELHLLDYPQSIFVGLFLLYICKIILNIYWIILNLSLMDYPHSIFVRLSSIYICWIILTLYLFDYPQYIFFWIILNLYLLDYPHSIFDDISSHTGQQMF